MLGGQTRNRVGAFDLATGSLTSWNPNAGNSVLAMDLSGSTLFVGGQFWTMGGQARSYLAAVDTGTALPTSWNPTANDVALAVRQSGGQIYAGGVFTTVKGQTRSHVVQLDAAGVPTSWNPGTSGGWWPWGAVAIEPWSGGMFLGGDFSGVGGQPRNNIALVDGSGVPTSWNPNMGGYVYQIEAVSKKLIVAGRFGTVGGNLRQGLAVFCLASRVTDLSVAGTGTNSVSLSWTAVAPSHSVYRSRSSGGPYELIGSVSGSGSYVDDSAHGGVTYYYVVKAVDECESDASNEVSASATGSCTLAPDFEGAAWAQQAAGASCTLQVGWAAASAPCGGGVSYSVYRSTDSSFLPSSSSQIASGLAGTSFTDAIALESGTSYYYVVRATSSANAQQDTNLIRHTATPLSCTAGAPLPTRFLTARAVNGETLLEWVNPPSPYGSTLLRYSTSGYPAGPSDGSPVEAGEFFGTAGAHDSVTHTGLSAGQKYYYSAFVSSAGQSSARSTTWSYWPDPAPAQVKWAFSTGASSLGTSRVLPSEAYYPVSNDSVLYSLTTGPAGGQWRSNWIPYAMNAPSQQRPVVLRLGSFTVAGASVVAWVASQDGHVYAVNAQTGALLWRTAKLAEAFQASPSVVLKEIGGHSDLVIVATRNSVADNQIIALRPTDGSVVWSFDNGGGANSAFGIVSMKPTIDFASDRIYFTSRRKAGGSTHSIWCISFDDTSASHLWSDGSAVGDVDAAPILFNGALYVGDNNGRVHSFAPNGGQNWQYDSGSGQPIKGMVYPAGSNLFFSAGDYVYSCTNSGGALWAPLNVPAASPLLILGSRIYVGGDNSLLYSIDVSTGIAAPPVPLGDPAQIKNVGFPTADSRTNHLVVGAEDGVIYAVQAF